MTEEALDVRRVLRALGRRWLLIVAVTVAAAAGGVAVAVVQSPTFVAKSQVLLPPSGVDARGNPQRNIQTEQQIAESGEVVSRAGQALSPPLGLLSLRRRVKVVSLTPDILEVRASARSGRDAALLANAVATAYVEYSNDATVQVATTTLSDLQSEATALDQHIRQVNNDIADNTARLASLNPQSPEGSRQTAIIDSLRQDLTDTARELSSVNTKISDARLSADLLRRGTRLLQPAGVPSSPATPRPVWDAALGGAAGLLVAVVVVLVTGRNRRRLRNRDDIARVVAAPVLVSLAVPRRDGVDDYRAMLDRWQPSLEERWSLVQAFSQVALEAEPTNLAILTLAGDVAGPGLVLLMAKLAASVGNTTALVVDTHHPDSMSLRAACNMSLAAGGPSGSELSVYTAAPDPGGPADQDLFPHSEVTVTLVVADGGPVHLPTQGRRTIALLALSSGFATAEQIATTAVRCFDAGYPIAGVLVANPDPADGTTGRATAAAPPIVDGAGRREPSSNGAESMTRRIP